MYALDPSSYRLKVSILQTIIHTTDDHSYDIQSPRRRVVVVTDNDLPVPLPHCTAINYQLTLTDLFPNDPDHSESWRKTMTHLTQHDLLRDKMTKHLKKIVLTEEDYQILSGLYHANYLQDLSTKRIKLIQRLVDTHFNQILKAYQDSIQSLFSLDEFLLFRTSLIQTILILFDLNNQKENYAVEDVCITHLVSFFEIDNLPSVFKNYFFSHYDEWCSYNHLLKDLKLNLKMALNKKNNDEPPYVDMVHAINTLFNQVVDKQVFRYIESLLRSVISQIIAEINNPGFLPDQLPNTTTSNQVYLANEFWQVCKKYFIKIKLLDRPEDRQAPSRNFHMFSKRKSKSLLAIPQNIQQTLVEAIKAALQEQYTDIVFNEVHTLPVATLLVNRAQSDSVIKGRSKSLVQSPTSSS